MSQNIQLLKRLLDYVEEYEKEIGNTDIKEFSIFLSEKLFRENSFLSDRSFDKNNYAEYKSYAEVEFSTLLTNLYRFAKHYLKKAFVQTEIKTIDEFGFLASLLKEKSMLKSELINQHILETSSGSEVLKRLINNGLVEEVPDQHDRRAKRVSLSKKGGETILGAFDEMYKISEIIIGNLDEVEIKQALHAFNKLNYFHQHIYENDRNASIDELYNKYIPSYNG